MQKLSVLLHPEDVIRDLCSPQPCPWGGKICLDAHLAGKGRGALLMPCNNDPWMWGVPEAVGPHLHSLLCISWALCGCAHWGAAQKMGSTALGDPTHTLKSTQWCKYTVRAAQVDLELLFFLSVLSPLNTTPKSFLIWIIRKCKGKIKWEGYSWVGKVIVLSSHHIYRCVQERGKLSWK